MADAGWYPDPADPSSVQYWDGERWTGDRRPLTGQQTGQPAPDPAAQTQQPVEQHHPTPQPWNTPGQQQWGPPQEQQPWANQPATTYAAPAWAQQQPAQQPWPVAGGEQGQPKKKRTLLYVAAAVVVLLVAGLVAWLVWPDKAAPKYTYEGKALSNADTTLSSAESMVNATVLKRHGAKSADTRCYFAQAKEPASGTKKSDVDQSLRCGPVLFVDGDPAQQYLSVTTTSTRAGGKVELKPQPIADDADPAAVPATITLSRPDGKTAPAGNGGLKVPDPPAADANVLTTAELGTAAPPKSLDNAVMVAKDVKVTLTSAGEIERYGTEDEARSAPSGQQLIAFRILYGAGDVSGSGSAKATLVVGGQSRTVPQADSGEYVVAGVPSSGDAKLQLVDGGVTQTLSVPDGKPGAGNIQVLTRKHRTSFALKTFSVPVKVSKGSSSANLTLHGRVSIASLDYWIPAHTDQHASSPKNGILSMNLTYTRTGSSSTFGFDPQLVKLHAGGKTYSARNVAGAGRIDNVFEVPASFTSGTVVISGSEKASGITLRITKATSFTLDIPAG